MELWSKLPPIGDPFLGIRGFVQDSETNAVDQEDWSGEEGDDDGDDDNSGSSNSSSSRRQHFCAGRAAAGPWPAFVDTSAS